MSENIVIGVLKSIGGVIRAIAGPIQLLGLAAIGVPILAYIILPSDQFKGLRETEKFYLIGGLIAIFLVIVVIIGVYILRGGGVDGPKTPKQALARFAKIPIIPSPLPVMVMTTPDLVVRRVSPSAIRFFGKDESSGIDTVVGRRVTDLIKEMRKGLDPPSAYWSDLGLDQARVIKELIVGDKTYARLPVRINEDHRSGEFRDKTYVPVITERDVLGKGDDELTIVRILYLDIAELPRNLFTERVWNEAVKGLDPQKLAQELREIKTAFDARFAARAFAEEARKAARAFVEDEDGGRERCDALKDAIEKLQRGGSPSTLDDLSRAGWFEMRDEASRMQEKPRQVLRLIDAVLGRVTKTPATEGQSQRAVVQ